MLSCKDVCYIVSESLDGKLPLHKRLSVRFHLLMCKACQRMVRQMELLRAAARRYESGIFFAHSPVGNADAQLSRSRTLKSTVFTFVAIA